MRAATAAVLMAMITPGCGGPLFEDGNAAYAAGDFKTALSVYEERIVAFDAVAPPTLMFNAALAALQTDQIERAEILAERAAARGGRAFYDLRDFVLGNAAFRRGELVEIESKRPQADPTILDQAIKHLQMAMQAWSAARARRDQWPQADHNLEIARQELARLIQRKQRAQPRTQQIETTKEQPPEQQFTTQSSQPDPAESVPAQAAERLSQADVERLLAALAARETEKRRLRRNQQEARATTGENDW